MLGRVAGPALVAGCCDPIDAALHREAALVAAAQQTSLNAFLVTCIEQRLRAFRAEPRWAEGGADDPGAASLQGPDRHASNGTGMATPVTTRRS